MKNPEVHNENQFEIPINRPRVINTSSPPNRDRLGSKTAPIDTNFVLLILTIGT
jgi:hypothetical protein